MLQFIVNGLCRGAVYALVALGFGMIYTTTGVFHLAHGAVYLAGAYVLYGLLISLRLPLAIAAVAAVLCTGMLGMLIEFIVYRPLARKKASSSVVTISSLGVYFIGVNLVAIFFGNETHTLSRTEGIIHFGSIVLSRMQIIQLVVAALVVGCYWLFLHKSHLGTTCRAVADDSTLASVLGVPVERVRLLVFAVGSLLAGAGAILVALDIGLDPYVGFPAVLTAVVACIIGGLRTFMAPAFGAVLLGLLQSLVVWRTSSKWEGAVTFTVLILFLLLRPQGLFGVNRRAEER